MAFRTAQCRVRSTRVDRSVWLTDQWPTVCSHCVVVSRRVTPTRRLGWPNVRQSTLRSSFQRRVVQRRHHRNLCHWCACALELLRLGSGRRQRTICCWRVETVDGRIVVGQRQQLDLIRRLIVLQPAPRCEMSHRRENSVVTSWQSFTLSVYILHEES